MYEEREGSINLGEYLRIILRGRWIILISFLLVLATTTYFTYKMEPVYQASATIMIEDKGRLEQSAFGFSGLLNTQTMIANQVEVIKSRTVAESVLSRLESSKYSDNLKILADEDANGNPVSYEAKLQRLRLVMSVEPITDTDIIVVKMTANSSFEAAYLANTVADEFYKHNL
ncbi:hypothetical protein KKA00_04435, partial [bacterium]|nr:hypothetical protein [bacterium]